MTEDEKTKRAFIALTTSAAAGAVIDRVVGHSPLTLIGLFGGHLFLRFNRLHNLADLMEAASVGAGVSGLLRPRKPDLVRR